MKIDFIGKGGEFWVTVDSGAEENVCPYGWGIDLFGIQPASRWMNFKSANGGSIDHYGHRDVQFTSTF